MDTSTTSPPLRKTRYLQLEATSPSGKALFVCTICGRTTACTDKLCPPTEGQAHKARCQVDERAVTTVGEMTDPETRLVQLRFALLRLVATALPRSGRFGFWERENVLDIKEEWLQQDVDALLIEFRTLRGMQDEALSIAALLSAGLPPSQAADMLRAAMHFGKRSS